HEEVKVLDTIETAVEAAHALEILSVNEAFENGRAREVKMHGVARQRAVRPVRVLAEERLSGRLTARVRYLVVVAARDTGVNSRQSFRDQLGRPPVVLVEKGEHGAPCSARPVISRLRSSRI